MNPKWDCGSASYYSRLTDTNYEKVQSKLKAKLKEENPPKVTISTDGWTQHHDAFLGINGHYIDSNWVRKKITLACSVFNTEHTGINIWKQIDEVLVDWDLLSKVFFLHKRYRDCGILEWNPVPFPIPSRTRIPSRYRFLRDTG